jgi:DNA-binding response OmpR family regulator
MASILVAEDEQRIASFVEKGLRSAGFGVGIERDGPAALEAARSGQFDLLVLDIGLPRMSGFEVLQQLRAEGNQIAVIILTARDSAVDTVTGFEGGANDYMSKPFRFDELLARVRVRLQENPGEHAGVEALTFADLELDLKTRRVRVGGTECDLSAREFALLEEFLRHPEQVLSREQLLSRVWGYGYDPGSNVVDVYVRYLRQKIGKQRLATVRGMGYRLTANHSD